MGTGPGGTAAARAAVLLDDPHDEIGPGLALDETAHLRKGKSAACVSPQHAGVTGRVENCVTWVFTALVTACGQAWVDFDVYMPDCWAKDPQRREKAGIPEGLTFATKPDLALEQVKRLIAGGLRVLWAADEVYGRSGDFRPGCEPRPVLRRHRSLRHHDHLRARTKVTRADQAIHEAVFEQRSCGNGAKRPRYADWALLATQDPEELLLIRRLPDREKNQYTFYLCHAAEEVTSTLTYFTSPSPGRRWPVETTFKTGKDAFGWDQTGTHLGRPQPAHRPDRPRPAQDHRHPVVLSGAVVLAGPGIRPGQPPRPPAARSNRCRPAVLHRRRAGSATAGQPCPPSIPDRPVTGRSLPARATLPRVEGRPDPPQPASPSNSAGQHGGDATRPRHWHHLPPLASLHWPPETGRPKGGDAM